MDFGLRIVLIVVGIIWFLVVSSFLKKGKLPVKYSLFWYLFAFVLIVLGIVPKFLELINIIFGFQTISNLVVGIILSMLMIITLILTIIVSNQKRQIKLLIQEVSLIKIDKKEKK